MTNQMIIDNARFALMEKGLLKGSGRIVSVTDAAGNVRDIEEPEEIHTFEGWKARGFAVNRGEHSDIALWIWKYPKAKKDPEDGDAIIDSRPFMTKGYFFRPDQVHAL